jgi:tetratricopeptide (TPR) repeat protein
MAVVTSLSKEDQALIRHAQAHQQAGRWPEALQIYSRLVMLAGAPQDILRRNMAGCLLAMGQAQPALDFANRALLVNPQEPAALWIQGKALRRLRQAEQAEATFLGLLRILEKTPGPAATREQVLLELSELALNEFCDPQASRLWVEQLDPNGPNANRIQLGSILTSLYNRTESAESLTQRAVVYARQHLHRPDLLPEQAAVAAERGVKGRNSKAKSSSAKTRRRLRVGLVSLHFSVSPVYFLTYSSFAELSRRHDLVFFSRRKKEDWGNAHWRDIATDWQDMEGKTALELATAMQEGELDAAFDLSGWMDPEAMQAFSSRPAKRQFKWVGGQAMTTGLDCFDAYLSDEKQTPDELHGLYTEPLAMLPQGYARYTRPGYFPKKLGKGNPRIAGIVGNPTKINQAVVPFVQQLARDRGLTTLRLIDRHYEYARVQAAVADCLEATGLALEFVVPEAGAQRHAQFLSQVSQLGCVVDTEPHSAGLTALEALHLGVEVVGRFGGQLFCERHAMSHTHYFSQAKTAHLAAELEQLILG